MIVGFSFKRDPDTLVGPDVSFYSIERLPDRPKGYFEIAPDLAVEVLSPSDSRSVVRAKIKHYIDAQVKLVWLVDPEAKTVTVYPGQLIGTELDETAMLDGGDVLPGFSCYVHDLFG